MPPYKCEACDELLIEAARLCGFCSEERKRQSKPNPGRRKIRFCAICGTDITALASRAVVCRTARCRKRVYRQRPKQKPPAADRQPVADPVDRAILAVWSSERATGDRARPLRTVEWRGETASAICKGVHGPTPVANDPSRWSPSRGRTFGWGMAYRSEVRDGDIEAARERGNCDREARSVQMALRQAAVRRRADAAVPGRSDQSPRLHLVPPPAPGGLASLAALTFHPKPQVRDLRVVAA
jgi:hypothetical protein